MKWIRAPWFMSLNGALMIGLGIGYLYGAVFNQKPLLIHAYPWLEQAFGGTVLVILGPISLKRAGRGNLYIAYMIAVAFGAILLVSTLTSCRQPTDPQEKPIVCDSVCTPILGEPK